MKATYLFLCMLVALSSCKKSAKQDDAVKADIDKVQEKNSAKVTITSGVWGTVSKKEGDCMPIYDAKTTTCKQYAIQREVRIYAYTTNDNATPKVPLNGLYDSFNTQLVKTVNADAEGFFQTQLTDGKYTIVFVEEGKLYASTGDGQGGISPVEVKNNKVVANLVLNRAVY